MLAGQGDGFPGAAAGRGRFRASHADRDRVIYLLRAAFAHGRLTKNEFDERLAHALAARTYAELAALTWAPASPGCRSVVSAASSA